MTIKHIPKDLKIKIMSYLDYMCEYKRMYKLEESEVLSMLNTTLQDQVIVHLNGRVLKKHFVFQHFDMLFLSEITFILEHQTFAMDDQIFDEGDPSSKMFFITKGDVILIQKKTQTFIRELQNDECFGDAGFFSKRVRMASARAKSFTETLTIEREKFLDTAKEHPES